MPTYEITTRYEIHIRDTYHDQWTKEPGELPNPEAGRRRPSLSRQLAALGVERNLFDTEEDAHTALGKLWDVSREWLAPAYRIAEVVQSVDAAVIARARYGEIGPGTVIATIQEWPAELDLIATLLRDNGRWTWDPVAGSPIVAARVWLETGYNHDDVDEWLAAKVTRPAAAAKLAAFGASPGQCAAEHPNLGTTIGAAVSDGLIAPEDACALIVKSGGILHPRPAVSHAT